MSPIKLDFTGVNNVQGSDIVRFPKLSQGAPYSFGLRIRLEDDSYRSFDDVVEMRWRVKLRPGDKNELFVLLKSTGNFEVDDASDTLSVVVKAEDWVGKKLPQSLNTLEMDVPFAHVIEFLDAEGVVTERFAQGSGFITVSLDF